MNQTYRHFLGMALIALALLTCLGGGLFLWLAPRQWEAIALLHVDHQELERLELERLSHTSPSEGFGAPIILTEFELIASKSTLFPVIEKLNLTHRLNRPSLHKQPMQRLDAYQVMKRYLVVVPLRDIGQMQVKLTTPSPAESAEIANMIATTYVRMRNECLAQHWGNDATNLISVMQWATPPPRPVFPAPRTPWIISIVGILIGGTGLFLLGKRLQPERGSAQVGSIR